jgi:MFS transporter, DHA1 family, multidrug resistance protein
MLAPLAGNVVLELSGWRAIFGVLAAACVVSLALTVFALPETLAPADRRPARIDAMLTGARRLVGDRAFVGLTLTGGFGFASFFVFIASASFVYTDTFGLGPTGFSLAFAINAIGFFASSQAASWLGRRYGMQRVVGAAIAGFAATTCALFVVTLLGGASLPVIVGGLFVANACLGLVIPSAMVLALDPHPDIAGLASSLGGMIQMLAGGLMVSAAGPFFDGSPLPMVATIALCGLIAATAAAATLRRPSAPVRTGPVA